MLRSKIRHILNRQLKILREELVITQKTTQTLMTWLLYPNTMAVDSQSMTIYLESRTRYNQMKKFHISVKVRLYKSNISNCNLEMVTVY